jgi:uncharacterized protein (DUF58 family)
MANAFRVEQERDVICLLDCGRLMAAPLGDRTRLDAALDAATAVGYTADELGDRFGAVAFSDELLRVLRPAGAAATRWSAPATTSSRGRRGRLRARVPPRRAAQARAGARLTDLLDPPRRARW